MTKTVKPHLLVFYDHFYPAYKAGGPIQSLTNLALSLQNEYRISVITSVFDLNETSMLPKTEPNVWTEVSLPQSIAPINVWYADSGGPTASSLKKLIKQVNPSAIYLNGMFSYRFVILPLFIIKKTRLVVCPRGMLQRGALAGKSFKKKIYLAILKMSGLVKRVTWHATNEEEKDDIIRVFGGDAKVIVAGNIPKSPVAGIAIPEKKPGSLELVYLSLISEKKNLLQLISIISAMKENISLDIYGPVKDERYWEKCLEAIKHSSGKVVYKGDVLPEKVQSVFSRYHASILLTRGENFGHALYESLSSGRPVITSHFTPWQELENKKAGWNVDISDEQEIVMQLRAVYDLGQQPYDEFCNGAYMLAHAYYKEGFDTNSYKALFSE